MRSQVLTVMAPEDEAAFLGFVFERPTARVIPSVRNPTQEVPHTREIGALTSLHCVLWDQQILLRPEVEYIPTCNDYYLGSNESLIQFLRSPVTEGTIAAGRIALATGWKGAPDTNPRTAPAISAWYNALSRWIKTHFKNSLIYASDFKPEVGGRERMVWAGPHAIEKSRQGVKLKHDGPPEYSLHYFDPADEQAVVARYRPPKNLIGAGRVVAVGNPVDEQLWKRIFRVAFDGDVPFAEIEGAFMCSNPEPKLGDEVACVLNENIFGRHAEPWEPREIKKLTPANRLRVLASLTKAWSR